MTDDQPVVLVPEFVGRGDELAALTRALAGGPAVELAGRLPAADVP
jgi:hypothetical protein